MNSFEDLVLVAVDVVDSVAAGCGSFWRPVDCSLSKPLNLDLVCL